MCDILCWFAFFLLVLLVIQLSLSIYFYHLMLSNSSIWAFLDFLLCYTYVEDREWSWFIWLETHWFGNFVGDYLSLEGRAEGGTVRKDTWVATREKLRSELGFRKRPNTWGQAGPRANWSNSSCIFLFVITEFCVFFFLLLVSVNLLWNGKMHYCNSIP